MAGLVTTPNVNIKGVHSLIQQVHGKNVTLVNKSSLSDISLLAQLLTGVADESEALSEAMNCFPGFLGHFYYTFATPCENYDLPQLIQEFPVQLLIKETQQRGINLVLLTANLDCWKYILQTVQNNTTERIRDTFVSIGLGKIINRR